MKSAFAEPHWTVITPEESDEENARVVLSAVKDQLEEELRREILNPENSPYVYGGPARIHRASME